MRVLATTLAFTLAAASAAPAHFDIVPRVEGGQLVTGGRDDSTGDTLADVRVFGFDFGEDPLDPFFAADPGFNTGGAGTLTPGAELRFDVTTPLLFWSGSGAAALGAPAGGETITLSLGSASVTLGSATGAQNGFRIALVSSGGDVHRHLNAFLGGASSPADGVYAFGITLAQSGSPSLTSDPLYIVFNNGLDESLHDAALAYVESTLVPEPASVLALGAGLMLARRRR